MVCVQDRVCRLLLGLSHSEKECGWVAGGVAGNMVEVQVIGCKGRNEEELGRCVRCSIEVSEGCVGMG